MIIDIAYLGRAAYTSAGEEQEHYFLIKCSVYLTTDEPSSTDHHPNIAESVSR